MKTQSSNTIHEDVDGLLPWYVNGTLSPDERDYVEAHISDCPEYADELAALRRIARAVQEEIPTPLVAEPDSDRLNRLLDAELSSRPRKTSVYLAAATFVAALFAGLLTIVDFGGRVAEPTVFETATESGAAALTDYVVRIRFADDFARDGRGPLLESLGVRDVTGLSGSSAVRGIVSLPAASVAELEAISDEMEAQDGIESVEVVAVQLPVHFDREIE